MGGFDTKTRNAIKVVALMVAVEDRDSNILFLSDGPLPPNTAELNALLSSHSPWSRPHA